MKKIPGRMDILLVEDNPGDVELVREALSNGNVKNVLHVASDGVQAMRFLRKEGEYAARILPDLVLLDLNLPRKSGREVLKDLKSDPALQFIPVIVLTSSKSEEDIVQSYCLHANCYVSKPVDFNQFVNIVQSIEKFWLSIVKLPFRN